MKNKIETPVENIFSETSIPAVDRLDEIQAEQIRLAESHRADTERLDAAARAINAVRHPLHLLLDQRRGLQEVIVANEKRLSNATACDAKFREDVLKNLNGVGITPIEFGNFMPSLAGTDAFHAERLAGLIGEWLATARLSEAKLEAEIKEYIAANGLSDYAKTLGVA